MLRTWSAQRICSASAPAFTASAILNPLGRRKIHGANLRSMNERVNAFVHLPPTDMPSGTLQTTVAVKDNICTSDMPTTCSSGMLQGFTSPFDATVVKLLKQSGAEILGKTNCDEFGMGSMNVHTIHGPVVNPFNLEERRSAGGSSGGSAAAVAAGMCTAALGTDTGGSIRLPASYCGVVGLKPSYGIISRWGVVSYADSLDCVGVLANSIQDTRRVFDVIAQFDDKDPTAARPETRARAGAAYQRRVASWTPTDALPLSGLRIGIPQEYFPAELAPSVVDPLRVVLAGLRARGATLVPVSLPSTPLALSAYYVLASAEASSCLARYDGVQYGLRVPPPPGADTRRTADIYAHTRSAGFGAEVRKRILLGAYALTADAFDNYFLKAQRLRERVRRDFDRVFAVPNVLRGPDAEGAPEGVDVLLHPSAIRTAPPLPAGPASPEVKGQEDGLGAYTQDVLTVPASLAGLPALSVPVGSGADGWPVGGALVGQWGCEALVLRVGEAVEGVVADRAR